jgi:glycosyltransferase involved in cell wall biosynthesis
MSGVSTVKQMAATAFLNGSLSYVRNRLSGKHAPRCFDRVCVVTSIGSKISGIARGALLQVEALKRMGIDVELIDARAAMRNPLKRYTHRAATAYIFHSGGPQVAALVASVLPQAKSAYRIAYLAWELPVAPKWPQLEGVAEEIWTCSEFAKAALAQRYALPISVVPHVVSVPPQPPRKESGVFQVVLIADSRSSLVRKNVTGSILAFDRAFRDIPASRLIIKLAGDPDSIERFISDLPTKQRITIISRFLSDEEVSALIGSSHVLLSLHRAEGFGLTLLEAMASGTCVLASRWSGNLDFMNDANSMLINCNLIPVGADPVYSKYSESMWADPSVEEAASALRRAYSEPAFAERLARNGLSTAQHALRAWTIPSTP